MAYEGITGETFEQAFYEHVAKPLNLTRSFWDAPANDSNEIRISFLSTGAPAEWSLGIQNA
jgi:CubicO group peptidase (beta-lactamase class C family)